MAWTTAKRRCLGSKGDTTCTQAWFRTPGTTSGCRASVAPTSALAHVLAAIEYPGMRWYRALRVPALLAKFVPCKGPGSAVVTDTPVGANS